MKRRNLLFALGALAAPSIHAETPSVQTKKPLYSKVKWRKIGDEELRPGDFWASHNPNTPERQAESEYNLQMQAVHPTIYGIKAKDTPPGNGDYWRPIGITEVF